MEEMRAQAGARMNFHLPPELRMLQQTVRKFVDKEMMPIDRAAPRGER